MKTYEIRVTAEDNDNDFCTTTFCYGYDESDPAYNEEDEEEHTANDVMQIIEGTLHLEEPLIAVYHGVIVKIEESQFTQGFYYTRYDSWEDFDNDNDSYGGMCTGSILDALEMAII